MLVLFELCSKASFFIKNKIEDVICYILNKKNYSNNEYAENGKEFVDDVLSFLSKEYKSAHDVMKNKIRDVMSYVRNKYQKDYDKDKDKRYQKGKDDFKDQLNQFK